MLGVTDYPLRGTRRPPAEGVRRGDRGRRHLQAHPGRRLLRRAGQGGAGPVLRGRRARRDRAASVAGAAWSAAATTPRTRWSRTTSGSPRSSASRSSPSGRSPTSARSRAAPQDGSDGYEVTSERSGAWVRQAPLDADRARASWSPPAPSAPTSCSPTAATAARCRDLSARLGDLVRTNSESINAVTAPERRAGLRQVGGDQLEHLSGPRHAHRGRDLRTPRRLHELPVHAPDRAGHEAHPAAPLARPGPPPSAPLPAPALAVRLVAAHGDPPGDADARQRHPAAPEATAARARREAADRAGSREAEPHLHPGRRPRGAVDGGADRRGRAERRSTRRSSTSRRRPTSWAAPRSAKTPNTAWSTRATGSSATRT